MSVVSVERIRGSSQGGMEVEAIIMYNCGYVKHRKLSGAIACHIRFQPKLIRRKNCSIILPAFVKIITE